MAEKIELLAQKRQVLGKKTNKLRQEGILPGIFYGHNFKSVPVQVDRKNFEKVYEKAGESTLVYLKVDSDIFPTIIHNVDFDPLDGKATHADFYKVRLDEKIIASVPLEFTGESSAVKDLGGILVKNINEIEAEAFPQDLPSFIEVDISGLNNFEDQILIKNLKVSDKVEIKENADEIVALVQEPMSEEELAKELEAPTTTAEDVEIIKKEKEEETEEAQPEESQTDTP